MVPKTAQTIASVVMLTFVLTAGYFVTTIPVWISWLKCKAFPHTDKHARMHKCFPFFS